MIRRRGLFTLKVWPLVTLVTIGLSFLTSFVAELLGFPLPEQPSLAFVRDARGMALLKISAFVLLGAPILEELIFRGLLYALPGKILRRFVSPAAPQAEGASPTQLKVAPAATSRGKVVAVVLSVLSSALFVAAHYAGRTPDGGWRWMPLDNAFLALFFFGCAQCWLFAKTRNLVFPMLNHALFNLVNYVLIFALPA